MICFSTATLRGKMGYQIFLHRVWPSAKKVGANAGKVDVNQRHFRRDVSCRNCCSPRPAQRRFAMADTVAYTSSEFVQTKSVPDIVNFALGQPGADIIPKTLIDETFVSSLHCQALVCTGPNLVHMSRQQLLIKTKTSTFTSMLQHVVLKRFGVLSLHF